MKMNSKGNVLIVDDLPTNLHLLSHILTEQGYKVQAVLDGPDALSIAKSTLPDLILLDIMMPEMSGYEVCERLKADESTRDIPIIFISALGATEDKIKALAVGGVDHITRPFQVGEVLARVETHLALRNVQKSLQEKNVQLEREIIRRGRAEETLHRYAERLKILHEIDQSILAARSPETIAVAAIGRIRQLIPCQRAMVMAIEETGQIKALATESSGEIEMQADLGVYQEMFEGQSLRGGRVQGVEDLATLARRSPMQQSLHTMGIRSYVVAPLFVQGELVGTLHLEATQPRAFIPDHIVIATEVAVLLAVAIRQTRLYERAQREIAERKRAQEALRQRSLQLEERNAELDAFAHTVAHDLKTPLTTLVGFGDLLEENFTTMPKDQLRQSLQMIGESGRKMNNIVDELLLLASIREIKEIEMQTLNMAHLVAEAQERLIYMIEEHQAEITLSPARGETWPVAQGYGPWVEEVWTNYLSNAIKYGDRPPRIECGATLQQDGFVRFWVRDNGPGLTPEEQDRLFTPFERLHQVRAKGHGLGLSIVKRIVEKLGGQAGVESEVGQGSTFWFALPCPARD
jgi:signal transduction histidine kinase